MGCWPSANEPAAVSDKTIGLPRITAQTFPGAFTLNPLVGGGVRALVVRMFEGFFKTGTMASSV